MLRRLGLAAVAALLIVVPGVALHAAPAPPPLAASDNVHLLGNIPGTALGMNFKGNHAYVTGPDGLTVLDITKADDPQEVGFMPLPHFENEDVDLCGNTLLISNDREKDDYGAILYVVDITKPTTPAIEATLPLGLTGKRRGSGHIANFVKSDCSQAWMDGGNLVEVVDLKNPAAPKSLGMFESEASKSKAFTVTHDTERDPEGYLWQVGGGGAAGYRLTANPLKPELVASTGKAAVNPSPMNDFILHNSQRRGETLLVTEEDYVDTDEVPPGGCRGQGHFETWSIKNMKQKGITPLDSWTTELNGMFTGGASDSKAPVTANCSSHWFDERAGIVAVGWYEQGTRFLDVRNPSDIRQVGFYLPANGSTWAAYFSPTDHSGQIVYTADAYRGVDVLKIDGSVRGRNSKPVKAPIQKSWFGPAAVTAPVSVQRSEVWGWSCPIAVS